MPDPQALIAGAATVSDKIRALDAAGYSRAEIARHLGKRYQHVRNVLEADRLRSTGASGGREPRLAPAPGAEAAAAPVLGGVYRLEVRDDGSVLLPGPVLQALGVEPGQPLMGELGENGFSLVGWRKAARLARDWVRSFVPSGVSLADELIADRRREAEREGD